MRPERPPLTAVRWRSGGAVAGEERIIADETPVAIVHDGTTTAVLMASPGDLEDLAIGFSLTEGIIERPSDVADLEVLTQPLGVEVRLWLRADRSSILHERRRRMLGPSGCGLCGVESLEAAARPARKVGDALRIPPAEVAAAISALEGAQELGRRTRAAHAAGWWTPGIGLAVAREDVGRHNALDKLAGALAREGRALPPGAVVLTSRVSIEMVQKAAACGAEAIIAVSAPTTLAAEAAEQSGMTLIAVARADGFEVFAGPHRMLW